MIPEYEDKEPILWRDVRPGELVWLDNYLSGEHPQAAPRLSGPYQVMSHEKRQLETTWTRPHLWKGKAMDVRERVFFEYPEILLRLKKEAVTHNIVGIDIQLTEGGLIAAPFLQFPRLTPLAKIRDWVHDAYDNPERRTKQVVIHRVPSKEYYKFAIICVDGLERNQFAPYLIEEVTPRTIRIESDRSVGRSLNAAVNFCNRFGLDIIKEAEWTVQEYPFDHVLAPEEKILTARHYWKLLGDTTVDKDGHIDVPFLDFPVGTDREEIWHWFEETFDIPVHDLMYPNG